MIGNSFNLVDSIRGYLSDTFTNRLALLLGESHEKTQTALYAATPAVLSELDSAATTPEGARRIAAAIDDSDDTFLENYTGLFGKDFSADSHVGSLRSILGTGGFTELTSNLGRVSGLSLRSITSLIGVLMPVMFGVIKRTLRARALRSTDIGSFLSSQRANIAAALPSGMTPRLAGESYPRDTRARRTETETTPESTASRWVLPLVGALAAIGLIWYLASRSTVPPVREARTVTERTRIPSADLTTKYQSVINEARTQGVQLSTVRQENGKLMLKGTAPSQEAANKVMDEIRRVNPRQDDIVADFSVASSQITPTTPGKVATGPDATVRGKPAEPMTKEKDAGKGTVDRGKPTTSEGMTKHTYTVKKGDTLGTISKQFYGNTKDYRKLVDANRSQIPDPNVIHVGQEIMIP